MFFKLKIHILFLILKLFYNNNIRLVKTIENEENYMENIINNEDLFNTEFYCPQKCICESNTPNIISNQSGKFINIYLKKIFF